MAQLGVAVIVAAFATACAADSESIDHRRRERIVHGADDRQDYFAIADTRVREHLSEAMVALIPNDRLEIARGTLRDGVLSWAEKDGICLDERFAEQPAAAFCSGVLVDWDLVLTAGHCARVYALRDFKAVLHYSYRSPGELTVRPEDILDVVDIEAEELASNDFEPLRDYAWLRLRERVREPVYPVALRRNAAALRVGQPILNSGAPGGVPLKFDAGATVRALETRDGFLIADTDTSKGSSGGGAFDADLALIGIMSEGSFDLVPTDQGCQRTAHESAENARERFTLIEPALDGLCKLAGSSSSLCRPDCEEPCQTLPLVDSFESAGCTMRALHGGVGVPAWSLLAFVALRRRRRACVRGTAFTIPRQAGHDGHSKLHANPHPRKEEPASAQPPLLVQLAQACVDERLGPGLYTLTLGAADGLLSLWTPSGAEPPLSSTSASAVERQVASCKAPAAVDMASQSTREAGLSCTST